MNLVIHDYSRLIVKSSPKVRIKQTYIWVYLCSKIHSIFGGGARLAKSTTAYEKHKKADRRSIEQRGALAQTKGPRGPSPLIIQTKHKHTYKLHEICQFVQFILGNIIKIVVTRFHLLKIKCTRFDFGWGFAPHPAGGALSGSPRLPSWILRSPTVKGNEGRRREDGGRNGKGKRGGQEGEGQKREGEGRGRETRLFPIEIFGYATGVEYYI